MSNCFGSTAEGNLKIPSRVNSKGLNRILRKTLNGICRFNFPTLIFQTKSKNPHLHLPEKKSAESIIINNYHYVIVMPHHYASFCHPSF